MSTQGNESFYAWCVENGFIRFSNTQTGTLEIVYRADMDPMDMPGEDDFIFNGDMDMARMFSSALIDSVTAKMCELEYSSITPSTAAEEMLKRSWEAKRKYWQEKSEISIRNAVLLFQQREQQVVRLPSILGRVRRKRDYS
jgi:hypothetical protein